MSAPQGANNPAMTSPAAQRLRRSRPSSHGNEAMGTSSAEVVSNDPRLQSPSNAKNTHGWRRVIRNLSPSWFATTMGTGIVANILIAIPWRANWLYYLSIVFFGLNVCLFSTLFVASLARYIIWPEIWTVMINDAVNSLFLGTVPMGFATIIEMFVVICVPAWGPTAAYVAWVAWMVDSVVAVVITVSLGVLLMSASHQRSLDTITAAQLLPIAATIVAAGAGSKVAAVLPNQNYALGTIITCYVMWGMATPMAFTVLVMYYQRLALHKLPPREVVVSAFLPLGPLGFGGFTVLNLGKLCKEVFPKTGVLDPMAGSIAYVLGFFVSLIMWAWGLLWFGFALASIYKLKPFPFNMGWWSSTFPGAVWSISAILIGEEMPSLFFRVVGTIFGTSVIGLYIVVALGTARGAWNGTLFNAPCLANLKPHSLESERSLVQEEKEVEGRIDEIPHSNQQHTTHSRLAPDIER